MSQIMALQHDTRERGCFLSAVVMKFATVSGLQSIKTQQMF